MQCYQQVLVHALKEKGPSKQSDLDVSDFPDSSKTIDVEIMTLKSRLKTKQ